jgi:dihydroorotate dehydrogenase
MSLSQLGFSLAKPLLHKMDAEQAHKLTIAGLKSGLMRCAPFTQSATLGGKLFGLNFTIPVGLAPGFDKNAEVPDAMLAQGFGFVEIGTVTPLVQTGNPRPRLFRLVEDEAVINRMGFNNEGADAVFRRLEARRARGGIVGVNIGANKDSEDRIADYVLGVKKFSAVASYITVNISSPNTPGLRNLQGRDDLLRLLSRLNAVRLRSLPMLLKIAPDLNDEDLGDVAEACADGAVDGVIISNTTISRPTLLSSQASEQGGLSGKPLFELSTRTLARFYQMSGGQIPLIGVGGVRDVETAWSKICAGASLIQLYSALVYHGPALVKTICEGLTQKLRAHNFTSLHQAVGLQNEALGK